MEDLQERNGISQAAAAAEEEAPEVTIEMQDVGDARDWFAEYATTWAREIDEKEVTAQRIVYFWKFMSFLPVPVGMIAWVFGALDLQDGAHDSAGIALMVVGGFTVFLDRLKPRKYLVAAKEHLTVYREAAQYLYLQAALPPNQREHPEAVQSAVLAMLRRLDEDSAGMLEAATRHLAPRYEYPLPGSS